VMAIAALAPVAPGAEINLSANDASAGASGDGTADAFVVRLTEEGTTVQVLANVGGDADVPILSTLLDGVERITISGSSDEDSVVIDHTGGVILLPIDFIEASADDSFTFIASIELSLVYGWNLVAIPFVPDETAAQMFAGRMLGEVWDSDGEQYFSTAQMIPGKGYWVYIRDPGDVIITGTGTMNSRIFELPGQWHLVGVEMPPPYSVAVAFEDRMDTGIAVIPHVWCWEAGRFRPVNHFEPGKGYWVTVKDQAPPTVEIVSPAPNADVLLIGEVVIQIVAEDNVGIASVEFTIDGQAINVQALGPGEWRLEIGPPFGNRTIEVTVTDAAGFTAMASTIINLKGTTVSREISIFNFASDPVQVVYEAVSREVSIFNTGADLLQDSPHAVSREISVFNHGSDPANTLGQAVSRELSVFNFGHDPQALSLDAVSRGISIENSE